jgi:hypothetical protein
MVGLSRIARRIKSGAAVTYTFARPPGNSRVVTNAGNTIRDDCDTFRR